MNIKLPKLPEPDFTFSDGEGSCYYAETLRARDIEVAKAVLEAAAKYVEELPCACCWPEGSDSVAEEFSAGIRALEISHD